VERIRNILYLIAGAASTLAPDHAAALYAGLHPPGHLVAFLLWVAENVAADVVLTLMLYPVLLWVWRRLTPCERCRLTEIRDRVLPLDRAEEDED
jgi:hypothetical protein